jgi:transposase
MVDVAWTRAAAHNTRVSSLSKPRTLLTGQQGEIVKQLKKLFRICADANVGFNLSGDSAENGKVDTLHRWLQRAKASGLHSMQQFVRTLRQDLSAVEAAILQDWSNDPVESQVNPLNTLKRQMYGRDCSSASTPPFLPAATKLRMNAFATEPNVR